MVAWLRNLAQFGTPSKNVCVSDKYPKVTFFWNIVSSLGGALLFSEGKGTNRQQFCIFCSVAVFSLTENQDLDLLCATE